MLDEAVGEAADEPAVAADPAGGVEAGAAEPAEVAGLQPGAGQDGGEDPDAVLHPLGGAAVHVEVPVGDQTLLEQ